MEIRGLSPRFSSALNQKGPWSGQEVPVGSDWLKTKLSERIQSVDWKQAKEDVIRFLQPEKRDALNLWSVDFFQSKLERLF